jgi:hypothetical protein
MRIADGAVVMIVTVRGRSHFGPGAYIVRYAWWSPIVPAVVGAALVTGFVLTQQARPERRRWLPGPHPTPAQWVLYGASWLMPLAGLALLVLAVGYLRRALTGRVAFAIAGRGVYWCPSGRRSSGRWFPWDEIAAIEFHAADGGSTGHGAVALCAHAPDHDGLSRLVSTRLGGWRIGYRRLDRALQRFAPEVRVIR